MCQFSIAFSGSSEGLLQRAETEIQKAGGSFAGDSARGNFHVNTPIGAVEGAYQVVEQEITLSILKKPFLLSCSRIEKELRGVVQ